MAEKPVGFIKEGVCIYLSRSVLLKIILEDIRLEHWNLEHFLCPANVATEQSQGRKKLYFY